EAERLAVDQERARELREPGRFEREKRAVQDEARDDRESAEAHALHVQRRPEDVAETERPEPERLDEIGERSTACQQEHCDHAEEEEPAASPRRPWRWPVDRVHPPSVYTRGRTGPGLAFMRSRSVGFALLATRFLPRCLAS